MTELTDEHFKKKLTPEQYKILRQKATEAPFSGTYLNNKESGMYACAACGVPLFNSATKFDSGSGWPSFYEVASSGVVNLKEDISHGMHRVEATCSSCGSHLGHVFDDAPATPTGQRYCINSAALEFLKEKEENNKNKEKK